MQTERKNWGSPHPPGASHRPPNPLPLPGIPAVFHVGGREAELRIQNERIQEVGVGVRDDPHAGATVGRPLFIFIKPRYFGGRRGLGWMGGGPGFPENEERVFWGSRVGNPKNKKRPPQTDCGGAFILNNFPRLLQSSSADVRRRGIRRELSCLPRCDRSCGIPIP